MVVAHIHPAGRLDYLSDLGLRPRRRLPAVTPVLWRMSGRAGGEGLRQAGEAVGATAALMQTLLDPTSELHAACEAMRIAGGDLLRGAQQAGQIRSDVTVLELFSLVSGLSWAHEQTAAAMPGSLAPDRLLQLAVEGLVPRVVESGVER
ncbi:hypothetical protein [Frankia gtarii]|uniref:SbtR family transcriptional regulator n=1 Tax=Frankia gtarii TaxID=2950102 RepID=UPI0021BF312C|nr:hypothetical protein [Frankia gtarii]